MPSDVDLDLVDRLLGARRKDGRGVDIAREADQAGSQADEAVPPLCL